VLFDEVAGGEQARYLPAALTGGAFAAPPLLDGRDADVDEPGDVPPGEAEVRELVEHPGPAAADGAGPPLDEDAAKFGADAGRSEQRRMNPRLPERPRSVTAVATRL
jgi:hypothetical protein